ncbi:hypothetical protein GGI07_005110 [Coemansia sp. Benny D115]|nr:hypothetical protein GGI07_005110 [Coemansia sp. Benny D115]
MTITLTNNDALNQFVRSNHLAVLFFFNEPYASTNLEFVNKAQPFFRKTRDNWPNWKFAQFNNENVTVPKTLHEIKSQMGIIFYVRGVCIGHMQSFDEEKYKKAMDTLPGLP